MSFRLENLLSSSPQTISFNDVTFDSSLDRTHPNKMPFHGILLLLDEPSQQPPHGAEGHPIEVPREAAEDALKSLVGMGINYKPDLEGHDPKKKIGVISKAWIEGNKVEVEGIIWPKDFPEAVRALRANRGDLGMSMELGNVYVKDQDADVWVLEKFHFTGATVLKKESAAYQHTSLAAAAVVDVAQAAAAAAMGSPRGGKQTMGNSSKSSAKDPGKALATAIAAGVQKAITDGPVAKLTLVVGELNKTNEKILKFVESAGETQKEFLIALKAASKKAGGDNSNDDDSVVDIDVDAVLAATHGDATDPTASNMRGKADASSSSSTSAVAARGDASSSTSATDSTADPTTASDQRAAGDQPGLDDSDPSVPDNRIVNKDATDHAHKQSKSGAAGQLTPGDGDGGVSASAKDKNNKKGVLTVTAATAKLVRDLSAQLEQANTTIRKQNNKIQKIEAQLERYAERVERRTLSPEVINLLEKTGHNPMELMASGSKMSVGQVDEMFDKCGLKIDVTTRMALKNQMLAAGIMDQGIVNRQRVM